MRLVVNALRDRWPLPQPDQNIRTHIDAAANWIARAQDATGCGGVSARYELKAKRWAGAYPETTGYIIPTFYDYAAFSENPIFAERAYQMAAWEADIQLENGAVRAGTLDSKKVAPTIFNTGQVLFGWARAWRESQDKRFCDAAVHASEWLLAAQDADGAWRRFGSPHTTHHLNTYNTRTAYGLAKVGVELNKQPFLDAAVANVEWAIGNAHENAWLDNNDLQDNNAPLTHTIAYALRGILEVGVICHEQKYIDFAERMARAVGGVQRNDGALPGRLDKQWRPAVRWSCLTGNAQMAINWLRLAEIVDDPRFRQYARKTNRFNMATQRVLGTPEIQGAIKGSHPIDGGYMAWRYPNWAAKFFMDALMLEEGFSID